MTLGCLLISYSAFSQCGTFVATPGAPGGMTTVDLTSFDADPSERFVLTLSVTGGDGGAAPNGPFFASTGGEGEGAVATFEVPATGNLVYITGEVGASSAGGLFDIIPCF